MFVSTKTSLKWPLKKLVNYDCNITTLAQVVPLDLFNEYMMYCARFKFFFVLDQLLCESLLDRELKRDKILQNFGIVKKYLSYTNFSFQSLEDCIEKKGYCIIRIDTEYLKYYKIPNNLSYFNKIVGHKVVIVDFDQSNYYLIDCLDQEPKIYCVNKELVMEGFKSSLINRYDKSDSAYYFYIKNSGQNHHTDFYTLNNIIIFDKIYAIEKYYKILCSNLNSKKENTFFIKNTALLGFRVSQHYQIFSKGITENYQNKNLAEIYYDLSLVWTALYVSCQTNIVSNKKNLMHIQESFSNIVESYRNITLQQLNV
jgi:hypothetical protein